MDEKRVQLRQQIKEETPAKPSNAGNGRGSTKSRMSEVQSECKSEIWNTKDCASESDHAEAEFPQRYSIGSKASEKSNQSEGSETQSKRNSDLPTAVNEEPRVSQDSELERPHEENTEE